MKRRNQRQRCKLVLKLLFAEAQNKGSRAMRTKLAQVFRLFQKTLTWFCCFLSFVYLDKLAFDTHKILALIRVGHLIRLVHQISFNGQLVVTMRTVRALPRVVDDMRVSKQIQIVRMRAKVANHIMQHKRRSGITIFEACQQKGKTTKNTKPEIGLDRKIIHTDDFQQISLQRVNANNIVFVERQNVGDRSHKNKRRTFVVPVKEKVSTRKTQQKKRTERGC
jgi:hypothetical protein